MYENNLLPSSWYSSRVFFSPTLKPSVASGFKSSAWTCSDIVKYTEALCNGNGNGVNGRGVSRPRKWCCELNFLEGPPLDYLLLLGVHT